MTGSAFYQFRRKNGVIHQGNPEVDVLIDGSRFVAFAGSDQIGPAASAGEAGRTARKSFESRRPGCEYPASFAHAVRRALLAACARAHERRIIGHTIKTEVPYH